MEESGSADAYYQSVIQRYNDFINPYLARLMAFAGFGVEMKAEGCWLWDHEGRKYLDCLGGYGVFSLGHRNPVVIKAVKDQLDEIALSAKTFFSDNASLLAEKLASITPDPLQYSFFCNSGTEAVEAALKFAKASTGRLKIVSTEGSFHGKTIGSLSTTGRPKYRTPFEPLMPGVVFVPYGDPAAAAREIDSSTACMIIEAIQGEGGIQVPPPGYLVELRRACDRAGALLIIDEVQTGFGRTGKLFGFEHDGVCPDLLTLAKSLGGGIMPIGCVMGTAEIWQKVFEVNPMAHTCTFGGSPLACAAGLAAIEVLEKEGLVERSRILGEVLLEGLKSVKAQFPEIVADVRGRGLMVGLEFAMDEVGELVVAQLMKRGVCVAYALNNPRVLRFEPPLIIEKESIDFAVKAVEESIGETAELLSALA